MFYTFFIRTLPTYQSEGKVLGNYLYKISSHVCYSYFKKKGMKEIDDEILEDKIYRCT